MNNGRFFERLAFIGFSLFAMFFFTGCTVQLNTVVQPTTVAPHDTLSAHVEIDIISGVSGIARVGEIAVLFPSDWSMATSTYYLSPLHVTDSQTEFVVTTTVAAPEEAPEGYQWYIAQTPGTEDPFSDFQYTAVMNMVVGNATGTYSLKYYVGDVTAGWTSNQTQNVEVRSSSCADATEPTDTDSDGYLEIYSMCQLQMMQNALSANYELMNDLDTGDPGNEDFVTGKKFIPIGTISVPYSGHFDGHYHTISGLHIYQPELTGVGLFGAVTGRVTNLRLADVDIIGGNRVGAIAGKLSYDAASIVNVGAFGNTTGTDMVGGLVGELLQSTVSSSYSGVNLYANGTIDTGGIVGLMGQSRLANVYSTGNITSTAQYVGGLVGYNSTSIPGSIINAYTTGNISGTDYVGGLVGYNARDDISFSFSVTNPVSRVSASNVGGLIGGEELDGSSFLYTRNYWLRGLDAGIGNYAYAESSSSTKWETVDSADVFKGNPTALPFRVDGTQIWNTDVWSFSSGLYPQLMALSTFTLTYTSAEGGSLEGTAAQTVQGHTNGTPITAVPNRGYRFTSWSDGSTANPRTETNVTTDHALTALFQTTNSGGGAVSAPILPSGTGMGARDASNPNQPIGSVVDAGLITSAGVNVLTYITNQNLFRLMSKHDRGQTKNHSFTISSLDLGRSVATLDFQPNPISLTLQKGTSQAIDTDDDHVADLLVTFSDLYNNRAEITLAAIPTKKPPVLTHENTPTVSQKEPFLFTRPLRYGITDPEVRQLQKWLNTHGFVIAISGAGSPGHETSFFGSATKAALKAFQIKQGLLPPSGTIGPRTMKALNTQ